MTNQAAKIETFRALHTSGCFVLPNPWDPGTARYLEQLGFKAVATTSAGFAFSRALPDAVKAVPVDLVLAHQREIVAATTLPVNADFQNCYADAPEAVAANVTRCIQTGIAGFSLEDATGDSSAPLYDFALAVARVKAARKAIDESGIPVVLTARCEAWLVGAADPLCSSLERLVAFAAAGADCLYAPGVSKLDEIAVIVKAVAPRPVNVLVSTNNCDVSVPQLAELGVRRVSVGAALARVAWGAFMQSARDISEQGSFKAFAEAAPFNELNDLFSARA